MSRPEAPEPPTTLTNEYDRWAWLYDFVVGSHLYHRVVWGMSPSEHRYFAERALQAAKLGPILDAGCGSLLFTARAYAAANRPLVLLDASRGMLARARQRLIARGDQVLGRFSLVHGDLLALPFPESSFENVFHFGVLHCVADIRAVLSELHRVAGPGNKLFLSTLVLGRPRGDAFLRRLHRKGHIAEPRTAHDVLAQLERQGWKVAVHCQHGSFLFVEARRS